MISEEVLNKIWRVTSEDNGELKTGGGICVAGCGMIITHLQDIFETELYGCFGTSSESYKLKICYPNKFYNLALLQVCKKKHPNIAFPYFDVGVVNENGFDRLERGDVLLDRGEQLHFVDYDGVASRIGYLCRKVVNICSREDGTGHSGVDRWYDIQISTQDFIRKRTRGMCVKHILGSWDIEKVAHLTVMGNTPVMEASGLGFTSASLGSPVFDSKDNLIGLYYLHFGGYSYIIPIGVLYHFMSLRPSSAGISQGYEGVKNMLSRTTT